jgi:hypothetical protein
LFKDQCSISDITKCKKCVFNAFLDPKLKNYRSLFESLGLGFGFSGGSRRRGNYWALGWEGFSSLGEQHVDILGFMLLDHGMILINGGDW